MKDEDIKKKFEDIKKIFTVAWVKERKILVGTLTTIIVSGLIFFIVSRELETVCFASASLELINYCNGTGLGVMECLESSIDWETETDEDAPLCFLKEWFLATAIEET